MSDAAALNRFLASVQDRAFRIARYAVRDSNEALDIVQDTMLTLARKYGRKPESEWPPLFHRILQNRIRDWHRRSTVRGRVMSMFRVRTESGEELDPVDLAVDGRAAEPDYANQMSAAAARLEQCVAALPERQRQAFLLRAWEGLDVAETAAAMRCSDGSVKTHYSRAVHRLREQLEDDWP
jgi:RNA polymerase sigma-70 factor (ECF subfamily)